MLGGAYADNRRGSTGDGIGIGDRAGLRCLGDSGSWNLIEAVLRAAGPECEQYATEYQPGQRPGQNEMCRMRKNFPAYVLEWMHG